MTYKLASEVSYSFQQYSQSHEILMNPIKIVETFSSLQGSELAREGRAAACKVLI